ncbi:hypothetical protein [Archaeoglobus sp.]
MSIDEFIEEVKNVANTYSLKVEILARTKNAIKIRVPITENIYIQLYYNQESKTRNYVLIGWNRRLFGRDCIGGEWHKHPFENPEDHDFSQNGRREVIISEFFEEVFRILRENGLI